MVQEEHDLEEVGDARGGQSRGFFGGGLGVVGGSATCDVSAGDDSIIDAARGRSIRGMKNDRRQWESRLWGGGDGETKFRGLAVGFAGVEDGGGEMGMVDGVGIVLGFEAEGVVLFVGDVVFADESAVEEVGGVELEAGLGGPEFEAARGGGFGDGGGVREAAVLAVEDDVVIVAIGRAGHVEKIAADGFGGGEVDGGVFDGSDLAGGDQMGIDGRIAVGVDLHDVGEDVGFAGVFEVEIGVVGEVDGGGLGGGGEVVDAEGVADEGVGDGDVDGAGVTFRAVGIGEGEAEGGALGGFQRLGGPDAFVVTIETPVKMVAAVVGGEGVGFIVEGKCSVGDAIGKAADDGAEVGALGFVLVEVVEAEGDVAEHAVFVGDEEFCEDAAVGEDRGGDAGRGGEGVGFDGVAAGGGAEGEGGDGGANHSVLQPINFCNRVSDRHYRATKVGRRHVR